MTQPEALRLAAVPICDRSITWQSQATIELRRLHEENKLNQELVKEAQEMAIQISGDLARCKQVCAATAEEWRADAEEWKAQRDALLEALQDLCDEQEGPPLVRRHRQWQAAIDKARAAIKAAEENT